MAPTQITPGHIAEALALRAKYRLPGNDGLMRIPLKLLAVPAKCGDLTGDTREITVMMSLNNSLSISVGDMPWLCEYGGLIPEACDPDDEMSDAADVVS